MSMWKDGLRKGDYTVQENKQEICNKLLEALQLTRYYFDLKSLEYKKQGYDEVVIATFDNDCQKRVNVSMDSSEAMIRDIINHIM